MDAFEPEILKVMAELGNEIVNRIYEANVVELIAPRAKPNSTSAERENWIRAKVFLRLIVQTSLRIEIILLNIDENLFFVIFNPLSILVYRKSVYP